MKALTLWQPWASLMADGFKKVETRGWATKYRGRIAIHSAQSIPKFCGQARMSKEFQLSYAITKLPAYEELPCGMVIASARLVSIELTDRVRDELPAMEQIFGNYEDGRYAWFFDDVWKLESPIPVKGNRMLWNWEPDATLQLHPDAQPCALANSNQNS